MRAIVSDSSPLIYLTRLGRFHILRELYGTVLIPEAVWEEVAFEGVYRPEGANLRSALDEKWLIIADTMDIGPELEGLEDLGWGEQQAIRLARSLQALLIIDEANGRARAKQLGVHVSGTVGVLAEAKLRGLIPSIRPELDRLLQETNFRLSSKVYQDAIRDAGEMESQDRLS